LGATAVLVAVYSVAAFVVAPEMYSDSAYGFMIWDSMLRGAAFNHLVRPDITDISRDVSEFFAIWSPGQYVFAGAIERLGISLGAAMTVVTTAFTVLGLAGWYRLYRSWNFPALSAAIAIVLTAGSRHFALPFGIYNGGEVLLFGTMPWFLLLLGRWSALSAMQALGILGAIAVVAFMKLSGILFACAALAGVVVFDLWPLAWPLAWPRWRRPLTALAIVIVFAVTFYLLWMSRGWTAVDGKGGTAWATLVPKFFEGWAATVMAMFSLGDLAARIFLRPGRPILPSLDVIYLAASVPALLLLLWSANRLRQSHRDYLRFAAATALLFIAGMAVIYGKGGELRMEDRFFRPLAMLLMIGIVHAVVTAQMRVRLPLAALAAATMLYGVSSYFVRLQHNLQVPLGSRGFHHGNLTHDGLALLRRELRTPVDKDTTVWLAMPEIALEFPDVRVIMSAEPERLLGIRTYKGRVGRLLVFVDDRLIKDGRAEKVLNSFLDYDRSKWVATRLGDATMFSQ
jgi:hypothetical protein